MKTIAITTIFFIIIALGAYFYVQKSSYVPTTEDKQAVAVGYTDDTPQVEEKPVVEKPAEEVDESKTIIGASVDGRDIVAYHFGTGDTELLFVGGMHGGYSWNTALVAYELMDYLKENEEIIPENVKVTIVPVLNPDGLTLTVGTADRFLKTDVPETREETIPGRFNAHDVDLNRNFDCDWQSEGTWQEKTVSGGSKAFSEPESQALKQYVDESEPTAVVVWYSSVGGVFASNCHNGILAETSVLTNLYAQASGYRAYENFDFYEITGDAVNWLAKQGIPAISVLLSTHEDTDWTQNKAGVNALLTHYAE